VPSKGQERKDQASSYPQSSAIQPRPLFISFEGPEGAGKTTQAKILAERFSASGRRVLLTREPGGTELGDRVRELVLADSGLAITARAETLLYCAARAQLVEHALRPALSAGFVVIADRYSDSTLAYQSHGRQLDSMGVHAVVDFATDRLRPDLTLLLDLPVAEGLERKQGQSSPGTAHWNRFEAEDLAFHERVRQGYLSLAASEPARWRILDARQMPDKLATDITAAVSSRLDEWHVADHIRRPGGIDDA
jgi:dTMP kinase